MSATRFTADQQALGQNHIRNAAPALGPVIDRAGPFQPSLGRATTAWDALVQAIVHQQLSMKAAATISGRLRALGEGRGYPRPAEIARIRDARLRKVGLSRQKISYLRDMAQRVGDGRLRLASLWRLSDERVIEDLCRVRGIGRWSAQMFLIFHLARPDVWPVGDLGLRNAVARQFDLDPEDHPAIERFGDRFRPFRSMATWVLWRSLEAGGL